MFQKSLGWPDSPSWPWPLPLAPIAGSSPILAVCKDSQPSADCPFCPKGALPCSHPAKAFASPVGDLEIIWQPLASICQTSLPHYWVEGHAQSMPGPVTSSRISWRPQISLTCSPSQGPTPLYFRQLDWVHSATSLLLAKILCLNPAPAITHLLEDNCLVEVAATCGTSSSHADSLLCTLEALGRPWLGLSTC